MGGYFLNVDEHISKYLALDNWFETPQGIRVAQAFSDELSAFQSQLRGEHLLQLGHCGHNQWLDSTQYRQKWIVAPSVQHRNIALATVFNQLPFERESIDCIVAPLTIEAFSLDKNPINELDRVLKPMGYIIFLGINPISFWGIALKLGYVPILGNAKAKLTSVISVKHAALSRGYRQCILSAFYYIPPVQNQKILHDLEFLNEMGKMLWLYPPGFYCLIVQKHEIISPNIVVKSSKNNYVVCADNSLA